jgi:hypothetical protein
MTVIVHMGLAQSGGLDIQHWFKGAEGVNYLGLKTGEEELDRANRMMLALDDFRPDPLREVYARALARDGLPVLANPQLSSWRRFDSEISGERVAEFFPRPKVIFTPRRAIPWAQGIFFEQMSFFQRDTFTGINPWLEKHMSRLRVGSHIAPARLNETLARFMKGSGATEVLILPYEMLQADRPGFIAAVEAFTGLEGRLAAVEARHEVVEHELNKSMANAYRMLGLRRRHPEDFMEVMTLFSRYARKRVQAKFEELKGADAPDSAWVDWFRTVRASLDAAIARNDGELMAALGRFDDYALRDGLAEYLNEVEADHTAKLLENFGVDLRPWGYGADAPVRKR